MKNKSWIGILILFIIVTLAYKNHFNNPFEFDDTHTIVNNLYIRDIKNIPLFFKDATTFSSLPSNQSYRPVVTTLNALDCWIGGKGEPIPFYFHLSIFLSFLGLGVLVFLLAKSVFQKAFPNAMNEWVALFATALFLLHTANVETISYIIARSDSFSALMIMLSLVLFVQFENARKYFLYLIPIIVGFLTKETAAITPILLFFYVLLFEEDSSLSNAFKNFSTSFKSFMKVLPALLLALVLFLFGQQMIAHTWTSGGTEKIPYWFTETFVMVHYINNFFFPFNLSADTDWTLITNPFDDRVIVGILFIISTLYLAFKCSEKREWRPVTFGILWFYIAQLPTSIFPFAEVLNDHRPFLPYIGLSMSVSWFLFQIFKKYQDSILKNEFLKYGIMAVFLVFFMAHFMGVRQRCYVWSSGEILWKDVTEKSPKNARGLMNYGIALMARGDYNGALNYFLKAKNEWPAYSYIYVNLGIVYSAMNNPTEAEKNFKYALQLNDKAPSNFQFYAMNLKKQGKTKEALEYIEKGLALSPQHLDLLHLKNEILANPTFNSNAQSVFEEMENSLKNKPNSDGYLNLSLVYYNAQKYLDCVHAAEKAIALKPNNDLAYNNICSAYNMLKDWDKAILAGKKAIAINPNNQLAKNNLAVALKEKLK